MGLTVANFILISPDGVKQTKSTGQCRCLSHDIQLEKWNEKSCDFLVFYLTFYY